MGQSNKSNHQLQLVPNQQTWWDSLHGPQNGSCWLCVFSFPDFSSTAPLFLIQVYVCTGGSASLMQVRVTVLRSIISPDGSVSILVFFGGSAYHQHAKALCKSPHVCIVLLLHNVYYLESVYIHFVYTSMIIASLPFVCGSFLFCIDSVITLTKANSKPNHILKLNVVKKNST